MFLRHIELEGFRNYASLSLDFSLQKVIFLGDNAQGKTNLLEAIAVLASGRSPFAQNDGDLVQWHQESAIVRARAEGELGESQIDLLFKPSGRRAIRLNGTYQKSGSALRGRIPMVLFSSRDLHLVKGAPGERRSFLDAILSQLSARYFEALSNYHKVLSQRNAYLKETSVDGTALQVWDEQLIRYGLPLMHHRERLIARLNQVAATWHARISGDVEQLELTYVPSFSMPQNPEDRERAYRQCLQEGRAAELARKQSLWGPQRDDMTLQIDGQDARAFASQGQQRTIVLSLKLAHLELLREGSGESPLLLLDDVLAELDIRRQNHLLTAIGFRTQVFVTSTHLSDFDARWLEEAEIYSVQAGRVRPIPR